VADLRNSAENLDRIDLSLDRNGLLRFKNKLYIPYSAELKLTILGEVHKKPYSGHGTINSPGNGEYGKKCTTKFKRSIG
jgi:hypothetical protein